MPYPQKPVLLALIVLLLSAAGCTTFEENAVATDPAVVGLEAEVEQQQKAVTRAKQETRRAKELLKAKRSALDAARHGVRADEAVK